MSTTGQAVSSYPKELDEKFARIGWVDWVPTLGITDEGKEVYLTDLEEHLYVMSTEEALSLTDEEFEQRLWDVIEVTRDEAIAEYERRRVK